MKTESSLQKYLISGESNVRAALESLNRLSGDGAMTLFVVGNGGRLTGSVTDGDIRRALLRGLSLDSKVTDVMNTNFLYGRRDATLNETIRRAKKLGIVLLPVIDKDIPVEIIDLRQVSAAIPVDAVLMAGGRGERLRPLTDKMPKPLLPVDGKAVIDYNVEALERAGIENIFVTVNYMADKIRDHFRDWPGRANITCVEEPKKLGTWGSLSLIEDFASDNIIVMNADLLTDIDFETFFDYHLKNGADFTMCGVPYTVSVPYAVMEIEDGNVKSLLEKPSFNYLANAGVYLMRRNLLDRLKKGEYMDAPDFINGLLRDGNKVLSFALEGRWTDIGSPEDYARVNYFLEESRP